MNLHHTVGDIRNFINALVNSSLMPTVGSLLTRRSWHHDSSHPTFFTTPYTIQTTFPNRMLEDNAQTIEQAGLKNSVVVQRLV